MSAKEERLGVRSKIWSIETAHFDKDENEVVQTGGGICIRRDGLILTVEHVVPRGCQSIKARRLDDLGFREKCVFYRSFPALDISLFFAERKNEDEVFDFFDLGEITDVDVQDEVFGFLHRARLPYSFFTGRVAYRYIRPEFDTLKLKEQQRTIATVRYKVAEDYRTEGFIAPEPPYRNAGGVIDRPLPLPPGQLNPLNVKFDDGLVSFNPDLPLIQISGFGGTAADATGESGCPLFKIKGLGFIGIISFVKGACEFVIPADFLNWFVKSLGDIARPPTPPPSQSARGQKRPYRRSSSKKRKKPDHASGSRKN